MLLRTPMNSSTLEKAIINLPNNRFAWSENIFCCKTFYLFWISIVHRRCLNSETRPWFSLFTNVYDCGLMYRFPQANKNCRLPSRTHMKGMEMCRESLIELTTMVWWMGERWTVISISTFYSASACECFSFTGLQNSLNDNEMFRTQQRAKSAENNVK